MAIITLEQYMNSATLMPAKYEESLTTVVHWPKSAGMILRNVWGRMMSRIDWKNPKPCDCAASNWLLGTELRPPRTISAMTAEVKSVNASTEMSTSLPLTVKYTKRIHSRLGVQRKSSM